MRLNSTVALTLILLALMLGSGFVSAMWGFAVGHEALKGVRQPDVRPTNKLTNGKRITTGQKELEILQEDKILVSVYAQMQGKGKDSKTDQKVEKKQEDTSQSEPKPTEKPAETTSAPAQLPITSEDQGVKLEVSSARQQGGSLILNVNLKNEGASAVRFLYSFLNVTDDQGRALSATAEGLPGELPPNGETFSGTVSIPAALLEDSQKLSLTLTDYPDQKLQLKMADIPIKSKEEESAN